VKSVLRSAALAAALLAHPALARASGATLPTGPVTLPPDLCDPDEPAERGRRFFVTPVAVRTTEDFVSIRPELRLTGAVLGIQYRTSDDLTVQAAAGVLGGTIDPGGGELTLEPGLTVQGAATWRVIAGYDEDPFVMATAGAAYLRTASEGGEAYRSVEFSLSLAFGKGYGGFAPYVAAKALAGPSTWDHGKEELKGNVGAHFQLAGGIAVLLGRGFDLQAEVSPWAAQAVVISLGWTR